jgi:hypothetical protein
MAAGKETSPFLQPFQPNSSLLSAVLSGARTVDNVLFETQSKLVEEKDQVTTSLWVMALATHENCLYCTVKRIRV